MLKKTISYVDYDNNTRTEDYYFNLSKAELMEMQLSISGGMEQMITNIVAAQDTPQIISIFKTIILKSFGVKSPDGKRFIKSEELTNEFTQTEAYSVLFMELATDADKAADFINGILPSDMRDQMGKIDPSSVPELAVLNN